ncbi:hypothetical protein PPNSA23_40880 [Phyllobacterium phragmitis]|uniref:Uncharacterized protein n=1 Tax=Phyllobacterium phragmitis TaxID=2670329 RepID=A0ABQ0H5F1_9HYPH
MILDQRSLGLADRLLDCMKLLGDVEARPACLDHFDDPLEMAVRALQPLYNLRVGFVDLRVIIHGIILSPWIGYFNVGIRLTWFSRSRRCSSDRLHGNHGGIAGGAVTVKLRPNGDYVEAKRAM